MRNDKWLVNCSYTLLSHRQLVYKQLALGRQIAKQLSGLTLLSLNISRNFRLKKGDLFLSKIAVKPTINQNSAEKFQSRIINYRSCKHFSNGAYRESLMNKLSRESFVKNNDSFQRFCDLSAVTSNKHKNKTCSR